MGWPRELTVVWRSVTADGRFMASCPRDGAQQAPREIQRVAPRHDLRFLVRVGGGDGEIDDAARMRGGEQRHLGFKLEVMPGGQPRAEPRAAHEAEAALAVDDAAAAQERRTSRDWSSGAGAACARHRENDCRR